MAIPKNIVLRLRLTLLKLGLKSSKLCKSGVLWNPHKILLIVGTGILFGKLIHPSPE